MSELISGRLRRWVRERGASPLLTYYDLTTGERTELSGISVANWVDKTSNLLADEFGAGPGDRVELVLAERSPGHWVTLVWQLACWQVGAAVTLGRRTAASVVVVGPGDPIAADPETPVLVCSLHPLGLPLTGPPPAGVLDYALEVRAQPDQHAAV
ncbi:MAG TPA: TIGR03089 family protein, partial [Propionibacteriaceae bacterium]|nr:TIGR03089 family protein [Propionibacteriaceae bacterium]